MQNISIKQIRVRDYVSRDYPAIMDLWKETGLGGEVRGDNQQIIEDSIRIGGRMLVAVSPDEELLATSWMTFDGRRIHLHHFGVKPGYQRMGIGRMLALESIGFARQKGYQVKLEVHQSNKAAIQLYTSLGFEYLGDYDVYIIRKY